MKAYKKEKFSFLNEDGSKKNPIEGDSYFNFEWRSKKYFPYFGYTLIRYKLIDNMWLEQRD